MGESSNGDIDALLWELSAPIGKRLEELRTMRDEKEKELAVINSAMRRIERVQRALLVEPGGTPAAGNEPGSEKPAQTERPRRQRLGKERRWQLLQEFAAAQFDPFTANTAAEALDWNLETVKKTVRELVEDNKLRFVGRSEERGAPNLYATIPDLG
jgi:hypothetical protein